MSAPTLFNCNPDEIEFLSDVLEDLKAIITDTGTRTTQVTQLKAVKSVLSEALERHRGSSDEKGVYESQHASERGYDVGGWGHSANGPSRGRWEFERLCKWYDTNLAPVQALSLYQTSPSPSRILNEVQGDTLEDKRYQAVIDKLEARCGDAAERTSIQTRPYNNPLGEAVESHSNSCYISLLPVEILQQIFRMVGSPHTWVQAPLVLSRVNSYFRAIVLDTPSLWVALDESLPLQILRLYATRSKNETLDVFTNVDHVYGQSDNLENDLFQFLSIFSNRIEKMTIAGYTPKHITSWGRRLQPLIFTSLTRLTIRSMNSTDSVSACPIWSCFPGLRDLWIEGCWCLGWVGPGDPFPQTLRSLRLTGISDVYPSSLLEALSGVLGLVRLVLENFALDHEELDTSAPNVTLTSLKELELASVTFTDMHEILLLVATPNLSSLSITSPSPSDGIADFDFLATFTAQHPQLSSLGIFGFNLELQELETVLHKLPNLNHLHIPAVDLANGQAAFLESDTTPFPRLSLG